MGIAFNGQIPRGFAINGERVNGMASGGNVMYRRPYALVSSGAQYIDTEYAVQNNHMTVEIDFSPMASPSGNSTYGAEVANPYNYTIIPYSTSGTSASRTFYTGNASSGFSFSFTLGARWELRAQAHSGLQTLIVNGQVVDTRNYNGTVVNVRPIHIFANNRLTGAQQFSAMKLYSFKLYDNNNLVRDLIPVPQGNTSYSATPAPSNCLWCKVTNRYYVNQGAGSFGIEAV